MSACQLPGGRLSMKEIRKKVGRLPMKVIFELVIRVIDNIEIDKSDL